MRCHTNVYPHAGILPLLLTLVANLSELSDSAKHSSLGEMLRNMRTLLEPPRLLLSRWVNLEFLYGMWLSWRTQTHPLKPCFTTAVCLNAHVYLFIMAAPRIDTSRNEERWQLSFIRLRLHQIKTSLNLHVGKRISKLFLSFSICMLQSGTISELLTNGRSYPGTVTTTGHNHHLYSK